MMYSDKMALAVKANGRVLRENKDTVFLPFGCEFSLLIKNLNSVRAIVKVWIDGTDVTEGTSGLIVPPNDSVDLERFIKNGNLHAGNRFKFIERTAAVSNHRGNKIDDGLIRVEFEFEQQRAPYVPPPVSIWDRRLRGGYSKGGGDLLGGHTSDASKGIPDAWSSSLGSADGEVTASYNAGSTSASVVTSSASRGMLGNISNVAAQAQSEVGITVAGSDSSQAFTWGAWFPTDGVKHVMVLRMLGEVEGEIVKAPITVAHKPTCTSCGKVNKANAKFCSECGTALRIV